MTKTLSSKDASLLAKLAIHHKCEIQEIPHQELSNHGFLSDDAENVWKDVKAAAEIDDALTQAMLLEEDSDI